MPIPALLIRKALRAGGHPARRNSPAALSPGGDVKPAGQNMGAGRQIRSMAKFSGVSLFLYVKKPGETLMKALCQIS